MQFVFGGWALSWGRGFFRGWVVISALWVVATVLVAKPSTYALLWNAPKYEVAFPSGRKVTVDTSRTHQELVALVDDALQQEPPPKPGEKSHVDSRDEILNYFDARYSSAGDRATDAWLITVVPPGVLFVIGIAVAWIIRGFRRPSAA
jgi:hypothetical protein